MRKSLCLAVAAVFGIPLLVRVMVTWTEWLFEVSSPSIAMAVLGYISAVAGCGVAVFIVTEHGDA